MGARIAHLGHQLLWLVWSHVSAQQVIAATSVLALCFAAWQIRRARKLAQIQHLLQLDHEFSTDPLIEYRFTLAGKRLQKKDDDPFELYRLLHFFETIGLLVRRGYLDPDDVWNTFGYWVLNLYTDSKSLILELRRDDPATYKEFVRLVENMRKIEKAEGGTLEFPSREDVRDFWQEQSEVKPGTSPPETGNATRSTQEMRGRVLEIFPFRPSRGNPRLIL